MDEILKVALTQTGLAGALVSAFIVALYTRKLVWGAELREAEKRRAEAEVRCAKEIADVRADFQERMRILEADRDDYREFCLELARHASKMAEATRAVVSG